MAGREKNCKWYFADQPNGQEVGPNNAMEQSFKSHPYASLVRESIQNSLDAVLDKSQLVRMKFLIDEMKGVDYPEFFELTGINNSALLQASHIVDWSIDEQNRTNPENGLCLNALFHKAYDENLLGITPDYYIIISEEFLGNKLREVESSTKEYIWGFNNKKLIMPSRFCPDKELLAQHFEKFRHHVA